MPDAATVAQSTGTVSIIVQAGSLGALLFVIWAIVFKVLPELTRFIESAQQRFAETIKTHEDDHRAEVRTLIDAHKEGLDKVAAAAERNTDAVMSMQHQLAAQSELLRAAAGRRQNDNPEGLASVGTTRAR